MASSSSSGSWKYDVFLSFRGEDTRKTFVDHLYSALQHHAIRTYKDDVTLDRGDTIGPSLLSAIEESHILVIIFSENYADSSWCLDELSHIMKCRDNERGQIVFPIFYHVDPSDVRKQKGQFGKAFAKHNNNNKVETWKKVLVDATNIAGWETKHVANGHEAKCIEKIVDSILDNLPSLSDPTVDDEDLIGMGTRLKDLKQKLRIRSGGVRMVGIWGLGGGGKTTLANSIYMELKSSGQFHGCCFVGNVREESKRKDGLKSLQEKVLSSIFDKQKHIESVDIGKRTIKGMLSGRNVLIVLDDVDDPEQLEALAGRHDWFGDGSRIIITTRNEHVLISHKVDEVYPVSLLSRDEAMRLFRRHAYHEGNPVEDYEKLSLRVISYVNGLPLALQILGSFLYGKDKDEWMSALDKLKYIPNIKVTNQLKISYDGLDHEEKELFLDIACFHRGKRENDAMVMLDACGYHPHIGIKVLKQKALISVSEDGNLDMHDLVQEMAHYIVRGEHPSNPEKHSRLWLKKDIEILCSMNSMMENDKIEAISCSILCSSDFIRHVSNMKKLRFLRVRTLSNFRLVPLSSLAGSHSNDEELSFQPNELRYLDWSGPSFLSNELRYLDWSTVYPPDSFPESFQPTKLVVLKMEGSRQKELWKGYKYLPYLKELELSSMEELARTPDLVGLPCLEKLILDGCGSLNEIHQSLVNPSSLVYMSVRSCMNLTRFPNITRMEKLKTLEISDCRALVEFPKIEKNMDNLIELSLDNIGIKVLPSSVGEYCTNLISLELRRCSNLKSIESNFHLLKGLKKFELCECSQLTKVPNYLDDLLLSLLRLDSISIKRPIISHLPRALRKLNLNRCQLKDGEMPNEFGELSNLQELNLYANDFTRLDFSLLKLTRLKLLNLERCSNLVELPKLPSNLAILYADDCESLESIIRDDVHRNCKFLSQVSITGGRKKKNIKGGKRLLKTMLQGNAVVESGCMRLKILGSEIPKALIQPRLVRGNRCKMQLPANCFHHFSGFLICAVSDACFRGTTITMKHVEKLEGNAQHDDDADIYWEDDDESKCTWIVYVSFRLLRNTLWWDNTSNSIQIQFFPYDMFNKIGGCGFKPVKMKTTTSTHSSSGISSDVDRYNCKLRIEHDSKSALVCCF